MPEVSERAARPRAGTVFLVFSALLLPIVFSLAATKNLSHDEHQHVAAGMLLAKEGLLPYRDFPHFHTPYLVFIYGALFRWSEHPLLMARAFSALCATGIVAVVSTLAFGLFRTRGQRLAWVAATLAAVLCLSSAVFTYTTGRAWNQEPCTLLMLLAFLAVLHAAKTGRAAWLGLSGVLLALAIGVRITCAPLVAPFAVFVLMTEPFRWKLRPLLWLAGGLALGGAGMLAMFAAAPEAFLFGNFQFAEANVAYRFGTGNPRAMSIAKKLRFLAKEVVRPDLALVLIAVVPWLAAWQRARRGDATLHPHLRFILLLLPFLLVGAFAPSPAFEQYFYPLLPFLVLAAACACSSFHAGSSCGRWLLAGVAIATSAAVAQRLPEYENIKRLRRPDLWKPVSFHDRAAALRDMVPSGRVLTLAPIGPLEAGLKIFPAFSTGPFAWRTAPFIPSEKAVRLGIVSPSTLTDYLAASPPEGILTGLEKRWEEPLVAYARDSGYRPVRVHGGKEVLWVPSGSPSAK